MTRQPTARLSSSGCLVLPPSYRVEDRSLRCDDGLAPFSATSHKAECITAISRALCCLARAASLRVPPGATTVPSSRRSSTAEIVRPRWCCSTGMAHRRNGGCLLQVPFGGRRLDDSSFPEGRSRQSLPTVPLMDEHGGGSTSQPTSRPASRCRISPGSAPPD
jgi:hypothetical protein